MMLYVLFFSFEKGHHSIFKILPFMLQRRMKITQVWNNTRIFVFSWTIPLNKCYIAKGSKYFFDKLFSASKQMKSAGMRWLNTKHVLFHDIPSHKAALQSTRSQEPDTPNTYKTEVWQEAKASREIRCPSKHTFSWMLDRFLPCSVACKGLFLRCTLINYECGHLCFADAPVLWALLQC